MFRLYTARRLGFYCRHYSQKGQNGRQLRRFSHGHGGRGNDDDRMRDYQTSRFMAGIGDFQTPRFDLTGTRKLVGDKVNQGVKIGLDQAGRTADQSYDVVLDQTLEKFQKAILKARNLDVHKTTVSAQVSLGGVISLSFTVEEKGQKGN